ncbi:MAG TPA: S8 family serine peptidase, partial [candidate division Zixibacteria bacterium]|nr:S8 family serine peptidase [candidate division Zixibacteria bacterium]
MLKNGEFLLIVLLMAGIFVISTSAADQQVNTMNYDAAFVKSKAQPKIESNLLQENSGAFKAQSQSPDTRNTMQVVFELKDGDKSYIKTLEDNGAVVEAVNKDLVQASVSPSSLQIIAELPFVNYVRRPLRPYLDVVSEGAGVINASRLHNMGLRGQGVKIAIIDGGFAGYQSKLGTELPGNVTVKSLRADQDITGGGEDHGTAVAEIVYDVAPDAQLYLINSDTEIEFANAVDYAISQDVDVISMSMGFLPGPFDGTGYFDEVVNNATAKGIVWVNSAGNFAQQHWEASYSEKTITVGTDTWFVHNFGADDETNSFYANAGDRIVAILSWNDWPHADQDYDLLLANEDTGNIVYGSATVQNGTQEPWEAFSYQVPSSGRYGIIIRKYSATVTVDFELYFISRHSPEYKVESSSLAIPADAPGVITVGATYWSNDSLEPFSSQGPTNDGRIKPDIVAPDGVKTSSYANFLGTSASAPHVAGAAALLFGIYPSLTNDTLRSMLESAAKEMGIPGKDNLYGSGRIDVGNAQNLILGVTANSPINQWVKNGTILNLNASITSYYGAKNATVDVSSINNTNKAVLANAGGYWINDSISVNTSNSGLQNLTVTVYDNASNLNSAVNMTVWVDNEPPNVTIFSTLNNSFVNTRNVTITGRVTDNFGIACTSMEHVRQIGGTGGSGCGGGGFPKDIPININVTLFEGWNRITLNYTDFAGNYGNASVNVTLDTTLPAVTDLSLSESMPKINTSVKITANMSDTNLNTSGIFVSVKHPSSYTNISQFDNLGNGTYSYNYTNTSEYGRYDVMIIAGDLAGNINNTEKTWFVTSKASNKSIILNGVKGETANGSWEWKSTNFPDFVHKENLNVTVFANRSIPVEGLLYKISREIITKDTGTSKNLTIGETWSMGAGYELTINQLDANSTPRQVWFRLKKGAKVDEKVLQEDESFISDYGYFGEPIIFINFDNIFPGTPSDMVQLRFGWLTSDNVVVIQPGHKFENLTVKRTSLDGLTLDKYQTLTQDMYLTNENSPINLTQDSSVKILGNLYFKVENTANLSYYPYFKKMNNIDVPAHNLSLDLSVNGSISSGIGFTEMASVSPAMSPDFLGFKSMNKFIDINASDELRNHLEWVKIKLYFTQSELDITGLKETDLKILWYNENTSKWELIPQQGVETSETGMYAGYVWANISHLSTFSLVGIYPSPTQTSVPASSGGGGSPSSGGGGGGGGGTSGENYS